MKITNFILFQLAWLVTIFSAAKGLPYVGLLFTLVWVVIHLSMVTQWQRELKLFMFAAGLGYVLESLLVITGFATYPSQAILGFPAPIWMVTLWINLAVTMNHSLSWLRNHFFTAAIMASVAGPVAYAAGERFGAINLQGISALVVISCMWFLAMPLLFWFSAWLNKQHALPTQGLPDIGGN